MTDRSDPTPLFHLAIPVCDLDAAAVFYRDVMGCMIGRRSDTWIDFNFFGHQLVTHLSDEEMRAETNPVDGEEVPVRHFGVILSPEEWRGVVERVTSGGVDFLIPPTVRHEGKPGEQAVFFVKDPSGNALEFKSFTDPRDVFAV